VFIRGLAREVGNEGELRRTQGKVLWGTSVNSRKEVGRMRHGESRRSELPLKHTKAEQGETVSSGKDRYQEAGVGRTVPEAKGGRQRIGGCRTSCRWVHFEL